MQWVPQPHAVQHVLDGTAGQDGGDLSVYRSGDPIDGVGGLEALAEVARIHGCPPHRDPTTALPTANRGHGALVAVAVSMHEADGPEAPGVTPVAKLPVSHR